MNSTLRSTCAAVALGIALMACGSNQSTPLADGDAVAATSTTDASTADDSSTALSTTDDSAELTSGSSTDLAELAAVDNEGAQQDPPEAEEPVEVEDPAAVDNEGAHQEAVTWTLTDVVEVVQSEPVEIVATASVPVFPDYPNGSAAVAGFVDELVDPWVEYAQTAEIPSDDTGGSFELTPRVVPVTESLVSVEFSFFEFLCCQPSPNIGTRSIVLNPESGAVLTDGDIVDLSRVEEIEQVWFDALNASDAVNEDFPLVDLITEFDNGLKWSALSVEHNGLFFSTDRAGASPGTSTFVSFDDLGDLSMPQILEAVNYFEE